MALLCVASTVFADDFGMNARVAKLVEFVNQPWIKGLAFIALVVECIGMITLGRQDQKVFQKFIPWIAGTVIFMAAATITNTFLELNDTAASTLKLEAGTTTNK